jgi:hypothetical protein
MNIDTQKNGYTQIKKIGALARIFGMQPAGVKAGIAEDSNKSEELWLLRNIGSAKKEWLDSRMSFEYAYDEELVDYFTYKIKACEARYQYFLKKAKKMGIKAELLENTGSEGSEFYKV